MNQRSRSIEKTVNLVPLPLDHRETCLCRAFESIRSGEIMQVIDDFDPEWIKDFIENHFGVELASGSFVVEESAGRYVVYVKKPEGLANPAGSEPSRETATT